MNVIYEIVIIKNDILKPDWYIWALEKELRGKYKIGYLYTLQRYESIVARSKFQP